MKVEASNPLLQMRFYRKAMSAGTVIKMLRKERKLTQAALAAEIGWERGTIAAIETGHDKPSADLVRALADFFNTTTDVIYDRPADDMLLTREDEIELIRMFRRAGENGKAALLNLARVVSGSNN